MTREYARELLLKYVKWAREDGSQDSPDFDFDPDEVFEAMEMGANALEDMIFRP